MKNKEKITKDTNILKAIEINPKAEKILIQAGLNCLGCIAAHFETLEQGLKAHEFNSKEINKIIGKMNK